MILLVEDEAIARYALARMLSLSGYKVMAAADGEHAFELLERHPFDVLITDLGLPGLSGFELIKQVRFKWPKTSVIVVSAETKAVEILDSETEFFLKPADFNEVIAAVKRLVPRIATLRDHTLICNWPPVWNNFTGSHLTEGVRREVGVLKEIRFNGVVPNQCFLLIEHEGEFYMGALIFSDPKSVGKSPSCCGSMSAVRSDKLVTWT